METKALKLMAYFGLLAVVVYAVLSAFGKRPQVAAGPVGRNQQAQGSVWARRSVAAPSSLVYSPAVQPTQISYYQN
jgi:hypothetical protein